MSTKYIVLKIINYHYDYIIIIKIIIK